MDSAYEKILETVYTDEQMAFESWFECVDYVKYRLYPEVDNYFLLAILLTGARICNENDEDITAKTCFKELGIKYEELEIHKEWQPLLRGTVGIVKAKTTANKKRGRKPTNRLLKNYMDKKQISSKDISECFGIKKSKVEKGLRTEMSNAKQFAAMGLVDKCVEWKENKMLNS